MKCLLKRMALSNAISSKAAELKIDISEEQKKEILLSVLSERECTEEQKSELIKALLMSYGANQSQEDLDKINEDSTAEELSDVSGRSSGSGEKISTGVCIGGDDSEK